MQSSLSPPNSTYDFAIDSHSFYSSLYTELRLNLLSSLPRFIRAAWPLVEPQTPLKWNWHLDEMCAAYEDMSRGYIKRLIVNVPPGSSKSTVFSVMGPAWEWAQDASLRFLNVSYSDKLTIRDNRKVRDIVTSPWFKRIFWTEPENIDLAIDQSAKVRFDTTLKGWRIASSVGGHGLGEHPDRIILDDLLKAQDARSDVEIDNVNAYLQNTISTRTRRDPSIVLIMQRLHGRDATDFLISKGGWTHVCYDDQTEILTQKGWKLFESLDSSDIVMGVNPKTLEARWELPTRFVKLPYKGLLIHYKSMTADICVTPEHRMIYADGNGSSFYSNGSDRWKVRLAKDLPRYFYLPQAIRWLGSSRKSITFAGQKWSSKAYVDFMGWYLSEGCANSKARSTRIVQKEGSKHVDEIDRVMESIPFHVIRYTQNGGITRVWQVKNKALAKELESFGKAAQKYIPALLKNLCPKLLRRFISAYASGDGHRARSNDEKICIGTASKTMADDLQECIIKCGWSCSVTVSRKDLYTVWIRVSKSGRWKRKNYSQIHPKHRNKVPYEGFVYCVSVPSTGLVVRRHGRVSVSGNCFPMRFVIPYQDIEGKWQNGYPCPCHATRPDPLDHRTEEGELLWPEELTEEKVEAEESFLGPIDAAGQLQQNPSLKGGTLYTRDMFEIVDELPAEARSCPSARGWDTADTDIDSKNAKRADWTCGVKMVGPIEGIVYVTHVIRFKGNSEKVDRTIINTAKEDGKSCKIREGEGSGKATIARRTQSLFGYDYEPSPEKESKIQRNNPMRVQAKAGNIKLLKGDWNTAYLDVLTGFPNARYDDDVDASSNAFNALSARPKRRVRYALGK